MNTLRATTATAILLLTLTACTGGTPDAFETTTPEAAHKIATASPAVTEAPTGVADDSREENEPKAGSRDKPLKPGQARRISAQSAFIVSGGRTAVGQGWAMVPITVEVDWKVLRGQYAINGAPDDSPAAPFTDLSFSFVTKQGRTYDQFDYPLDVDVSDDIHSVGDIYPPADEATGTFYVSVPADEVRGGTWVVTNIAEERVFLAVEQ